MFLALGNNRTGTCTCIVMPQTLYNQNNNHLSLPQVTCVTIQYCYKKKNFNKGQHITIQHVMISLPYKKLVRNVIASFFQLNQEIIINQSKHEDPF